MTRVDTHHDMIPPDHRKMLRAAGIDEAGDRALPEWSPEASLHTMAELDVAAWSGRHAGCSMPRIR
jgi:6-methylsalicylate decarboxylase